MAELGLDLSEQYRNIQGNNLVQAIREVGTGQSLLDSRAAATLMRKLRTNATKGGPLAKLTEREHSLLDLIDEGLANRCTNEIQDYRSQSTETKSRR